MVAGTYTGSPQAIEYQFAGKEWITLDANPVAGQFAVTVNLPMNQGEFRVRFADQPDIQAKSVAVGVGEVFLLCGQSNNVGYSTFKSQPHHPRLVSCVYGLDGVWKPHLEGSGYPHAMYSRVNEQYPTGLFNYEAGKDDSSCFGILATKFMALGIPTAWVPCAMGSTHITQWQAEAPDSYSLLGIAMTRARAVGDHRCMLFWQGESDTQRPTTLQSYAAALNKMINSWFANIGTDVMVVQIEGTYWARENPAQTANVRAAQAAVARDSDSPFRNPHALRGPDMNGLFVDYHYGMHRNAREVKAVAEAYFKTLLPLVSQ